MNSAVMTADAITFLTELARGLPPDERLIFCGFTGDPNDDNPAKWRPHAWRPKDEQLPISPQRTNGYVAVSSFHRAADHSWRRTQACFAAGRALMIDDVGTKVDRRMVEGLLPTAVVETSPANFQYWFFLDEPCRDRALFAHLIQQFIDKRLLGNDPGQNGVNRVGRVPDFINGKAKYGGDFRVRLAGADWSWRYSLTRIAEAFGLDSEPPARVEARLLSRGVMAERVAMFAEHWKWLRASGMAKEAAPNLGGWIDIRCPWTDEHTNRADTGASVAAPSEANGFYGAFRCHHGHCADKAWRDLTDWISEQAAEQLEQSNNG